MNLLDHLQFEFNDQALTGIRFTDSPQQTVHPLLQCTIDEISRYIKNPFHRFNIPLQIQGTSFQQLVWHALKRIPVGHTKSYGELAEELGTSARAIGNACRHNPIPIIFPCHRIVAKQGLGGFSGQTTGQLLDLKAWLLSHEQQPSKP